MIKVTRHYYGRCRTRRCLALEPSNIDPMPAALLKIDSPRQTRRVFSSFLVQQQVQPSSDDRFSANSGPNLQRMILRLLQIVISGPTWHPSCEIQLPAACQTYLQCSNTLKEEREQRDMPPFPAAKTPSQVCECSSRRWRRPPYLVPGHRASVEQKSPS
jgi:hypothetical protein